MKNLVLGLTLAAALATPLTASAQTKPASLPAGHYLLVDVQTGRTVGEIVALVDGPSALRPVGAVTAVATPLFAHIQTIGASSDDMRKAFNEQFGIVPSP